MNKHVETLEDLLCYLECARDSLLLVHGALESETVPMAILMNVVYGAHNHLDYIAKELMRHIEHIPADVMRRAGEEVADGR